MLLAAVIALFAELGPDSGGHRLSPGWASIALVLKAGSVGFFGFSSAWVRFIAMSCASTGCSVASRSTGNADASAGRISRGTRSQSALRACRQCVVAVDTLMLEETQRWVEAFSAAIEDIDKSARTTPAPEPRRAALNLTRPTATR